MPSRTADRAFLATLRRPRGLGATLPVVLPVVLLLAALLAAAATRADESPAPLAGSGPYNLTIFHTNDTHSAFLPRAAEWSKDGRLAGGVLALAHYLEMERRTAPASLLVDAGDFMTGNPVCNLKEDGVPGVAIAKMMNALGYDCGLVGNHEFDIGLPDLEKLAKKFDYPLLAADIVDAGGKAVFRDTPVEITRGGVRIGIMGVSCGGMTEVVAPSRFAGLAMAAQLPILRRQARELDPKTDLLVVLSHDGVEGDRALADSLAGSGIDVIVGGHSHTRLKEPELRGGILIVQAGSAMTNLGRLDLRVANDRVEGYAGQLVTLWADSLAATGKLAETVQGYADQVQKQYGRVLGTLAGDLRRGKGENTLGDWIADVIREAAQADVAVLNGGGIRRDLPAGPLTALLVHEVLPFANTLVTVKMTGAEVQSMADCNARGQVGGDHGILQVSGISYVVVPGAGGAPATAGEVTVGGKPLDPARDYVVAMPDFVAMMAPVYLGREIPPFTDLGRELSKVVCDAVEKAGTVQVPAGGRLR